LIAVEQLSGQDGLKKYFDDNRLDVIVCTFADSVGVPIMLAGAVKYVLTD